MSTNRRTTSLTHAQAIAADLAWFEAQDAAKATQVATERRPCEQCVAYLPDPINPSAGMGQCGGLRKPQRMYLGQDLRCGAWTFKGKAGDAATEQLEQVTS